MKQYIDKDALVAKIEKLKAYLQIPNAHLDAIKVCDNIISVIDTLKVKDVIAEQECTCNEALNRIIGGSWNLLCPVDKLGLKTDDKVKVIIKSQKGE